MNHERDRVSGDLQALVRPRFVGSAGWAATREALRSRFRALGYEERVLPFEASVLPGRYAFPAAGLTVALAGLGAVALLPDRRGLALLLLITAGALCAWIAARAAAATDEWRVGRLRLANLLFHQPEARPRWIVVAHLDSKSQFVPLLLRAAAAVTLVATWLALVVIAALGGPAAQANLVLGLLAILATGSGAVIVSSPSRNASPGALDNASGLATLLSLAERQVAARDVAFLVTDAEEIGLAGSRAVARRLPTLEGVINVDGVDDAGPFWILERFGRPRRGLAPHLALAVLSAGRELADAVRRRDVPDGLLLDHMSFVRAGIPAITLMRGTARSLARVHRPGDDRSRLRGSGVRAAIALLDRALDSLRASDAAMLHGAGGVAALRRSD